MRLKVRLAVDYSLPAGVTIAITKRTTAGGPGWVRGFVVLNGAGRKRRRTTWITALAVLGAWLPGVIPVVQVARTFPHVIFRIASLWSPLSEASS